MFAHFRKEWHCIAVLQESGVTLQEVALWHFGFDGILDGKGWENFKKK